LFEHSRLGLFFYKKNTKYKSKKKISMAIFHFLQYEQELFYSYWDHLHAYLAHCASCGYLYRKWKILHVVDKGVYCETRALFEHWDFYDRNVEEAWDFLNWLT